MRILKEEKKKSRFINRFMMRSLEPPEEIERAVKKILEDVKKYGDKAVIKYTKRFDYRGIRELRIDNNEIDKASKMASKKLIESLRISARRIRRFHERQKEKTWIYKEDGIKLGQIIRGINRVGIYVPGGRASYPSTVLMNVIPAQVAGVREIAVVTPTPDGYLNPAVAGAIKLLGINEVYRIGGAQAIGALAYGTETIKRVDKITGPGNIYVAIAKRMVYGTVDIDMIAGPSEVLIIADKHARAEFIVADLLSQAEHDEYASSILITDSVELAERVNKMIMIEVRSLKRKDIIIKSLNNFGAIIVTADLKEAVEIANIIAPEHLEIMVKRPYKILPFIENAGAVFIGDWTPEPLGDYSAGPNHTLPTSGTARFSSPLGVYDFIKRTSLLEFSRKGFMKLAGIVETIALTEGLDAHARTINVRQLKAKRL